MRTKGMERNEAHRQRLDLILHLQQVFLAQIIDTELGCCNVDNLTVIQFDVQFLGQDLSQFTATCTILTADCAYRIFTQDISTLCM